MTEPSGPRIPAVHGGVSQRDPQRLTDRLAAGAQGESSTHAWKAGAATAP